MKRKFILGITLLASTLSIQAEDKKESYTTLDTEKYVLGIHDSFSGGIISVFNLVKNNGTGTGEIQYKDNPELQAKLQKFKDMLNEKLQSNELNQTFYYKTASAELSDKQSNYLNNVILSLNDYENLQYKIKGFADTRGDANYNEQLSLKRINSVYSILEGLNVPKENLLIDNKGETLSEQNAGYEDLFFDRKVELIINKK